MSWPDKDAIRDGVLNMLRMNMALAPGERLLVATDLPRASDWLTASPIALQEMLERAMLARLVADVAAEQFPASSVTFLPFPAAGGHGTELDPQTAARMRETDVLLGLTTYSLSHTDARSEATRAGVRVASMPGFEACMFEADGPMAADHRQIAADCRAFAELLTAANAAIIRTTEGTNLRFSLEGRPGQVNAGLYDGSSAEVWGNLPGGESYAIPVEGTGEGQVVVPAGWYPGLTETMVLVIHGGEVVELRGQGTVPDQFRQLFQLGSEEPVHRARRNLAELGIGTNPNARRPDNVLEAEKIKGTVHIGIGDNIHMGGRIESDLHEDFVLPRPDLLLDGRLVIDGGDWRIT
jgi:aminopeptidase